MFFALALLTVCTNAGTPDEVMAGTMDPQSQTAFQTYVYECGGGYSFIARIEGKKAWLFLPNQFGTALLVMYNF